MDKLSSDMVNRSHKTGILFTMKTNPSKYIEFHHIKEFSEIGDFKCLEQPQNNTNTKKTKIGTIHGTNTWAISVVGTCNGLVCYKVAESQFGHVIYIFNPITDERICFRRAGTRFHTAGFGYCHSTKAYKVVRHCYEENGAYYPKNKFQVYTLGVDNDWRDKPVISYKFDESGVFANGCLHWLNKNNSGCDIVSFDLADETFQSLPSPPLRDFPSESYINVTVEGNLCLCVPDTEMDDVWVFKKKNINNCGTSTRLKARTYINSFTWIKMFSGKLDSGSKYQVLSLTDTRMLILQNGVISYYDIEASTPKRLWQTKSAKGYDQAIPHMNSSLVSLEDFGEPLVDREPEERPPEKLSWIAERFAEFGDTMA